MSISLNGATVLVTGANGGLGTQFVQQAIDLGAEKVYATARQPRHWSDERVVPLRLDVTDEQSVAQAASAAPDTSVVVNNAAISLYPDRLMALPMVDVRRTFDVNFFGALSVSRVSRRFSQRTAEAPSSTSSPCSAGWWDTQMTRRVVTAPTAPPRRPSGRRPTPYGSTWQPSERMC